MRVTVTAIEIKQGTSPKGKPWTNTRIKTDQHGDKWLGNFRCNRQLAVGEQVDIDTEQEGQYLNWSFAQPQPPKSQTQSEKVYGRT